MSGGLVAKIPIVPLLLVIIPINVFIGLALASDLTATVSPTACDSILSLSCFGVVFDFVKGLFLVDVGFPIYLQVPIVLIVDGLNLLVIVAILQGFIP